VTTRRNKTAAQVAFGEWLKAKRDELGISSADEAGRRAKLGQGVWRSLEAPGSPWHAPSARTVRGIADVLAVGEEEVAARAGVKLPCVGDYPAPQVGAIIADTAGPEVTEKLDELIGEVRRLVEMFSRMPGLEPPARGRRR